MARATCAARAARASRTMSRIISLRERMHVQMTCSPPPVIPAVTTPRSEFVSRISSLIWSVSVGM